MKKLLLFATSSMILILAACRKHNYCTEVTITQSGTPCSSWGIRVNGITYPSGSIPASFQQEGITVCADYELYDDMRLCACCGGAWAKINSMRNPGE